MSKDRAAQLVEAGIWLKLSGDVEGARKLFERALKLDPENEKAGQLLVGGPGAADAAQPSGVRPVVPAPVAPPPSAPPRAQADWQAATGYSPVQTPSPTLDSDWGRGSPAPAVPASRPSGWGAPMTVTLGSNTPVPQPQPLPMASLGAAMTVRIGSLTPVPQSSPMTRPPPMAGLGAAMTVTLGSPSPIPQVAPALGDEADPQPSGTMKFARPIFEATVEPSGAEPVALGDEPESSHRGATMQFARPAELAPEAAPEVPHRGPTMQFARPAELAPEAAPEVPHRGPTMQFARPPELASQAAPDVPHHGPTMQFARPAELAPEAAPDVPHRGPTMQFARPPELSQQGAPEAPHRGATMQFARPPALDAAARPVAVADAEPAFDVPTWDLAPAAPAAPGPGVELETPRGATMQFVRPAALDAAIAAARAAPVAERGPGGLLIEPMGAAPEIRPSAPVPSPAAAAAPPPEVEARAQDAASVHETPRGSTMQFVRPAELDAALKAARSAAAPAEPAAWDVPAWEPSSPAPAAAPASVPEIPRGATMQFARPPDLDAALKAARSAAMVERGPGGLLIEPMGAAPEIRPSAPAVPVVVAAAAPPPEVPAAWDVPAWDATPAAPAPPLPPAPETPRGATMQFARPPELEAAVRAARAAAASLVIEPMSAAPEAPSQGSLAPPAPGQPSELTEASSVPEAPALRSPTPSVSAQAIAPTEIGAAPEEPAQGSPTPSVAAQAIAPTEIVAAPEEPEQGSPTPSVAEQSVAPTEIGAAPEAPAQGSPTPSVAGQAVAPTGVVAAPEAPAQGSLTPSVAEQSIAPATGAPEIHPQAPADQALSPAAAPQDQASATPATWDVPSWDAAPSVPVPAPLVPAPETPRGGTMQFSRPPELEAAMKANRAAPAGERGPGGLVIESLGAAPGAHPAPAAWDVPAWDTTPSAPAPAVVAPVAETPRGATMQFSRPPELEAAVKAARAAAAAPAVERGPGGLLIEPMGAAPEVRPSSPVAAPVAAAPAPAPAAPPAAEPSAWDVPAWDLSALPAAAPRGAPSPETQKGSTMQFARPSEVESRPAGGAGRTMQFARPPELVAAMKAAREDAPVAAAVQADPEPEEAIIEGEIEVDLVAEEPVAPAAEATWDIDTSGMQGAAASPGAATDPSPWDVVPWDASAPTPQPQAPVWADSPDTAPGRTMVQFERPAEVKAAAQSARSAPRFPPAASAPAPSPAPMAEPVPWDAAPSPVPTARPPEAWVSAAESQQSGSMQSFREAAFDHSHTVSLSGDPGPEATPHSTPPLFGYTASGHPSPPAAAAASGSSAGVGSLQALGAMLGPEAGFDAPSPSSPPLFAGPAVAEASNAAPADALGFAWAWSGSNAPPRPQDADLSLVPRPSPAFAPKATSAWDARSNPGLKIESVVGEDTALDLITSSDSKLTPSPQAQGQVPSLLKSARALLDLDDHSGAMELILKAQALAPDDPDVKAMRERSEKTLLTMFESKLGRMETVPRVLLKDDEIIWLNLDHRAGFVLAQIDGTVSFDDLFSVSGMSRIDTARILAQLVEEGVISRG